jgi:hypothetical protein
MIICYVLHTDENTGKHSTGHAGVVLLFPVKGPFSYRHLISSVCLSSCGQSERQEASTMGESNPAGLAISYYVPI